MNLLSNTDCSKQRKTHSQGVATASTVGLTKKERRPMYRFHMRSSQPYSHVGKFSTTLNNYPQSYQQLWIKSRKIEVIHIKDGKSMIAKK
jgi:hypothetical protein